MSRPVSVSKWPHLKFQNGDEIDSPALAVYVVIEVILDHVDHDLIAHEPARVHDLLRLDAERGLPGDLLAKHVARGEMADAELLLDVGCLRTLACRAAQHAKDMSAHASSSSTRVVRILTRAWWTHEDHPQLWSRRSWRCQRWPRLCLLLEIVYPGLETFCERLEVLELILPTRWHLRLLLVVKEKQGEWANNKRREKQRRKATPNPTHQARKRTDRLEMMLPTRQSIGNPVGPSMGHD